MPRLSAAERERLVTTHLRLAYHLARRVERMGVDLEDLEQEAALGLCAAAQSYDPDRDPGTRFSAWARRYVMRYLNEAVSRHVRLAMAPLEFEPVGDDRPQGHHAADEVWEAIHGLSYREQLVVVRHFGLDGGPPSGLVEMSFHFGIPARTISRLLASARAKIGAELVRRGWREAADGQGLGAMAFIKMA